MLEEQFCSSPPGGIGQCLQTFLVVTTGATVYWAAAREAAKLPAMNAEDSPRTESYSAQSAKHEEAQDACYGSTPELPL